MRSRRSAGQRARWARPGARERASAVGREVQNRPEVRAAKVEGMTIPLDVAAIRAMREGGMSYEAIARRVRPAVSAPTIRNRLVGCATH